MSQAYQTDVSHILPASLPPLAGEKAWKGSKGAPSAVIDTVSSYAGAKAQQKAFNLDKPELEKGKSGKKDVNYLADLAAAYKAVYGQLSKGLENQVEEEDKLQTLDQTMSQIVILSANKQIKDELKAAKLVHKAIKKEEESSTISKIFGDIFSFGISAILRSCGVSESIINYVSMGIGALTMIVMLAVTVALAVPTGGLSLEADAAIVPMELGELTGELGEGAADSALIGEGAMQGAGDAGDIAEAGAEGIGAGLEGVGNGVGTVAEQIQQITQELEEIGEQIGDEATQSESKFMQAFKKIGIKLLKSSFSMGVAGFFSAPYLVQCITSANIAGYKSELAGVQRNIGSESSNVQLNNAYFRFVQQLIQQGVSVAQEIGSELGNVLEVYSAINKDYRDIATGLSQAV